MRTRIYQNYCRNISVRFLQHISEMTKSLEQQNSHRGTPSLDLPFEVSVTFLLPKSRQDCSRKKGRNFKNKTSGTTFFMWVYSNPFQSFKSHHITNQSFRRLPQQAQHKLSTRSWEQNFFPARKAS